MQRTKTRTIIAPAYSMAKPSFDVIIVADFRFPGGTSSAVAAEVRALHQGSHNVALYQMNAPILTGLAPWNDRVMALVKDGDAVVLPADAEASCHVLLIHSPWLFVEAPAQRLRITSSLTILVTHHAPTDARGRLNYDPSIVDRHASEYFSGPILWAPISPVCRDSFDSAGMTQPRLRDDWTNVVVVDDWGKAREGLAGDRPVIGRHSRPQLNKWPATRADVLAAYPVDPEIEVRLLGVGEEARALMNPLPESWTVWGFNEIPVKDFLAGIDFFVYFHNPDLVETFGLTIAEAAGAGCVVITHPYLEKTFGKAALYCAPEAAPTLVRSIVQDPKRFAELSAQGRKAIQDLCGPDGYLRRFRRLLTASQNPSLLNDLIVQPKWASGLWLRSCAKRSAYWYRNRFLPGCGQLLQRKAVKRPLRKIRKALHLK